MSRFRLSAAAKTDLRDIWRYVARDNPAAADRLLDAIYSRCRLLTTQPLLGEAAGDLQPGLRRTIVGSYLVFYEVLPGCIRVVRVIHGARNVRGLFPDQP